MDCALFSMTLRPGDKFNSAFGSLTRIARRIGGDANSCELEILQRNDYCHALTPDPLSSPT